MKFTKGSRQVEEKEAPVPTLVLPLVQTSETSSLKHPMNKSVAAGRWSAWSDGGWGGGIGGLELAVAGSCENRQRLIRSSRSLSNKGRLGPGQTLLYNIMGIVGIVLCCAPMSNIVKRSVGLCSFGNPQLFALPSKEVLSTIHQSPQLGENTRSGDKRKTKSTENEFGLGSRVTRWSESRSPNARRDCQTPISSDAVHLAAASRRPQPLAPQPRKDARVGSDRIQQRASAGTGANPRKEGSSEILIFEWR
ncbi:hypothetical protein B0T16DRAFT_129534 [Cercophora newfieldiana]|uniref:Uncharacterized protein n=1 Tax=Cercophora newfieldiana TaxID=92897 RepID=A0AA39YB31_9PEZI|nr:hypothetical protein B0T16DRAFT_129534 [Cercophora newfieldiana]